MPNDNRDEVDFGSFIAEPDIDEAEEVMCGSCGKIAYRMTGFKSLRGKNGGKHICQGKPRGITTTSTKESSMRTNYSDHQCAGINGVVLPICAMDNRHLGNMIRQTAGRFCEERKAFTAARDHKDPMVSAMMNVSGWDAATLTKRTNEVIARLQPYIAEAVLRGGTPATQAAEAMRMICNRSEAVELPKKVLSEPEAEASWDMPGIGMEVPE